MKAMCTQIGNICKKEVSYISRVGKRLRYSLKYNMKLYLGVPLARYMLIVSQTI